MERVLHEAQYYDCMAHFVKVFERKGRRNKFCATSKEEYLAWKKETRNLLAELIGLEKMEPCDLQAQVVGREVVDGIVREDVIIQVEPEVWMPFYIMMLEEVADSKQLLPIIAPHGHQGGGRYSVAGRRDIPAISEKIDYFNYDYGYQLAKRGYVVFCPDSRGFGQRREKAYQTDKEEHFLRSTCSHLSNMALPLGQTVIGMCIWDLMRLIDYIDECNKWDMTKLTVVGFSGGGMQTLWLTALDDRVKNCVISGYLYGYKDALLKLPGNCSCNYVPHLWEHVDMGDIGALIAPRPLYIQTGIEDHLNGERGVINSQEQVAIIREAYKLFGAEEQVIHEIHPGPHRWYGEKVYDYLGKVLKAQEL